MLTIAVQELPEATVLHCSGRIVYGGGTDALRRIAFAQRHKSELLIDMSHVSSIDASGLGALVDLWHWIHITGRTLKLLNPSASDGYSGKRAGIQRSHSSSTAIVARCH